MKTALASKQNVGIVIRGEQDGSGGDRRACLILLERAGQHALDDEGVDVAGCLQQGLPAGSPLRILLTACRGFSKGNDGLCHLVVRAGGRADCSRSANLKAARLAIW
jgi:hypothetical protein